jgi:hypothetical protein
MKITGLSRHLAFPSHTKALGQRKYCALDWFCAKDIYEFEGATLLFYAESNGQLGSATNVTHL